MACEEGREEMAASQKPDPIEPRQTANDQAGALPEARDEVFCDDGGLWVRDPLGNCRPFDINDYEALADERAQLLAACVEIARLRTDLSGDFSMASRQSDIARKALAKAEGRA